MNEYDNKERSTELEARRRILKASAAAPLLATLAPNAALAASSAVTCAPRHEVSNHKNPENGNSVNDGVIRQAVEFYKAKNGVQLPMGMDNRYYKIGNAYFHNSGRSRALSAQDLSDYFKPPQVRWVLAVFDITVEPAQYIGLWPQVQVTGGTGPFYYSHASTPLHGSCWTSLSGGQGLPSGLNYFG